MHSYKTITVLSMKTVDTTSVSMSRKYKLLVSLSAMIKKFCSEVSKIATLIITLVGTTNWESFRKNSTIDKALQEVLPLISCLKISFRLFYLCKLLAKPWCSIKNEAHKYTAHILSMTAFTYTQETKQACPCPPVRSN